jgi:ATP/ADP translocase
LISLIAPSAAYRIASANGFEPQDTKKQLAAKKQKKMKGSDLHNAGMVEKATKLFARVPVLGALFVEILTCQGLATILNVVFVARLETAIPDDAERAGYVGVFFGLINVCTMVLQIGILPPLLTIVEPRVLWRVLPVVSLFFTGFQALQKDPSLSVVCASLMAMKVSEYSARRMLDEMIYVPLDFGKKLLVCMSDETAMDFVPCTKF